MMDLKIQSLTSDSQPASRPQPSKSSTGDLKGTFEVRLKTVRRENLDGDLKGMLRQVKDRGKQFLAGPTEAKLQSYKDGIKQFLERVRKELFSLHNELGSSQDGQQKVFQLIETVDGEVDNLTREMLQNDKALLLLGSLDDIRGLALDVIG